MTETGGKAFAKAIIVWLIVGLAAGSISAVFLTAHEYREAAGLTGAVLESNSVAEGLKGKSDEDVQRGEEYLKKYGYRPYGNLEHNLLFAWGIHALIFAAAGGCLYAHRVKRRRMQRKRIRELTEYLQAVNRGEAGALSRTEDEFSRLEDEIYKTVMELACTKEKAVKEHEVLSERIADIAHQLKTPLTSMSLMTELLEEYQTEEAAGYMAHLKRQVGRLTRLVNGLLTLARLDSHVIQFQQSRVEALELIKNAAEPLREILERENITLEITPKGEDDVFFSTDEQWTGEALLNILKNCIEHTPRRGRICVNYHKNPLYTEIQVEDGGRGFSRKDLPHLFERFYRGEGAVKDSAGIGLALAKAIVEGQNGHIQAENSPAGHARFRLRFYPEPHSSTKADC